MKTLVVLFCCVLVQWTQAQSTVYVPQGPADTRSLGPFRDFGAPVGGMRYQQVYGASGFSSVPNGGYITALTFFLVNDPGNTVSNAQINLSTTSSAVDSLSPVFANNVGADNRVVLGPGSFAFETDGSGSGTVRLGLVTPFFYNPAAGNLLMDVRVTRGFSPSAGDGGVAASSSISDASSRVYAFGVNSLSGTADSIGLITGFTIMPVPEPSTYALFALGTAALWFCRRPPTRAR